MVLDLDETLIHSHHDGVLRQTVKPGTPPDFVLKVQWNKSKGSPPVHNAFILMVL